jgi:hypothetical protein
VASGSDSEGLYLGSWLAGRLGWSVRDAGNFTDRTGATVAFERKREGKMRRVQSITLKSTTSQYTAYVAGDDAVCVEATGQHAKPQRHVPLAAIDNTSLIERAILEQRTDAVFMEALQTVADLLK